jgi:hypothetical protein
MMLDLDGSCLVGRSRFGKRGAQTGRRQHVGQFEPGGGHVCILAGALAVDDQGRLTACLEHCAEIDVCHGHHCANRDLPS